MPSAVSGGGGRGSEQGPRGANKPSGLFIFPGGAKAKVTVRPGVSEN